MVLLAAATAGWLAAPVGVAADELLAQQALARMAAIDMDAWAFRRTLKTPKGTRLDEHDPTRPGPEHWQLLSVDGAPPTSGELRSYASNRRSHADSDRIGPLASSRDVVNLLRPGSLEVLHADGETATFGFQLQSPDGRRSQAWEQMRGEFRVNRNAGEPYVDTVRAWNSESFRPRFGVRLNRLGVEMRFDEAGGFVLPSELSIHFDGRALLLIPIEQTLDYRFHDLRHVAPARED